MTDSNMVIAAVIKRNGRYLVCQRPAHKRHGDLWEFPGGKLKVGESLHEAAVRELEEELCLHVLEVGEEYFSVVDATSGLMVKFVRVDVEGDPVLVEHLACYWALPAELSCIDFAPSDRLFVNYLRGEI